MAKKLVDIDVLEVSAVDRAANKREFLVQKQAVGIDPIMSRQLQGPGVNPPTTFEWWPAPAPSGPPVDPPSMLRGMSDYLGSIVDRNPIFQNRTEAENWADLLQNDPKFQKMYTLLEAARERERAGFDSAAQQMAVSKSATARLTLRDWAWSHIEAIANQYRAQGLTKYQAVSTALETETGKYFYGWHEDEFARLPMLRAVEKIAKRDGGLPEAIQKWLKT